MQHEIQHSDHVEEILTGIKCDEFNNNFDSITLYMSIYIYIYICITI